MNGYSFNFKRIFTLKGDKYLIDVMFHLIHYHFMMSKTTGVWVIDDAYKVTPELKAMGKDIGVSIDGFKEIT
jgi:hypothetical protein